MIIGNAIGTPFNTLSIPEITTVNGLLDFDGSNNYVTLSSVPDVTGNKVISFNLYVTSDATSPAYIHISEGYISSPANDIFFLWISNAAGIVTLYATAATSTGTNSRWIYTIPSAQLETGLQIVVTKTTSSFTSVTVNGSSVGSFDNGYAGEDMAAVAQIGYNGTDSAYLWNLNINDDHAWDGQPDGNLDTAWEDTIGSIDGTVFGSPSTINITY